MTTPASFLPPGQPRLKAPSVAQLTGPHEDAIGAAEEILNEKQKTVPSAHDVGTRNGSGSIPKVAQSDSIHSTLALIQRILAPQKHIDIDAQAGTATIEELLPPLTSSNEVDLELYAILAIIIKDFVNTWYSKITTDHVFTEEIIQIFAHCSRSLEQRLRHVDRSTLFLDEIPFLVEQHIQAYRTAHYASLATSHQVSIRRIYHDLLPSPALPLQSEPGVRSTDTTEAEDYESAYRQLLIQGTLAVLLPTEDLQNGPLRTLVTDVVADLIVGQAVAGKICQSWFLHDAITKAIASINMKMRPKVDGTELQDDAKSRLEKFGLLSSQHKSDRPHSSDPNQSQFTTWFWRILQYAFIALSFLRSVWIEFQRTRSHPEACRRFKPASKSVGRTVQLNLDGPQPEDPTQQPVLSFRCFTLVSTLLKAADRMPWMTGMIEYWQHFLLYGAGQIAQYDSLLDRLSYLTIEEKVLTPSLLPLVLRNLRSVLFPNNAMGPPAPPPPSFEEAYEIKHGAAEAIASLFPSVVTQRYYATNDDASITQQIEQDMLTPFDDAYLNKHLIYAILELILVRLVPELAEQTITDLLADRGVDTDEFVLMHSDSSEKFSDDAY